MQNRIPTCSRARTCMPDKSDLHSRYLLLYTTAMSVTLGDIKSLHFATAPIAECASGFESLPEENFRQILALIPLSQRIRSAELVSKHWRQALRDQEVLSVVHFAQDPLWRNLVSTKLFDHLVTRGTTAYQRGVQNGLTRKVVLTNCRLVRGTGLPMKFIEHCLRHCVHLEVIEATGFGGIGGAFHMNDLLVLLRTLNKMRPAPQLKEVWIDAWCPSLTCTWESSAYQRAIAVDAMWLTFMRMLEPGSRIKVRNIFCVDGEGDSLRPSEVVRTLTMRLHKLAVALSNSTHRMQVVFLVNGGSETSVVQQIMEKYPTVECSSVIQNEFGISMIPNGFEKVVAGMEVRSGSIMFTAKNRVVCQRKVQL